MRRFVLPLVVLTAVVIAGVAGGAAQHQISLTGEGPQPSTLKVGWGDTVVFTNTGTAAATLLIPRLELTTDLPAGQSVSQAFAGREGTYPFRQRIGNKTLTGTVTLDVSGEVKATAKPIAPAYGRRVVVTGMSPYPDSTVELHFRVAGSGTWAPLGEVRADGVGAFSSSVGLERGGAISALAAAGQLRSSPIAVTITPLLPVTAVPRRATVGRFVKVAARIRPAGAASVANLERYDTERKRWSRIKVAKLQRTGLAAFSVRATKGSTRLRVVVPRASVAPGYAAVTSKTLVVTGA